MKRIILLYSFILLINCLSYGQSTADYDQTLKRLFKVSGSEEAYKTTIVQFMDLFRQQYDHVSVEFWNDLEKEFLNTTIDDLVTMLAPVYIGYLDQSDLEEIIVFFESPVGQKYANNIPLILKESMEIGEQWGMKVSEKFLQKMADEGY